MTGAVRALGKWSPVGVPRGPGRTRVAGPLCALAVLLGLIAMHGLPFAAGGCADSSMTIVDTVSGALPGTAPAMASVSGAMSAVSEPPAAASLTRMITMAASATGSMATGGTTGPAMQMASCLSLTPDHPTAPTIPQLALLAFLAVVAAPHLRLRPVRTERAPPDSGADLLLRVCVSRT
ncbi:MAG TPA: hypothetical protein VG756_04795 [Pseudonocardiaceae bacterium]|nr:hypothetical protein [Pseudonocardiaceae bacterium]